VHAAAARRFIMKLFTRTKLIAPIGLVVATAGGSAMAAPPSGAQAPTVCEGMEESGPSEVREAPAREAEQREPFGPVALIGEGLSKVCLSDDQRAAIDKLGKQVSAKEESVMDARRELRSALVQQLKSGAIDERALTDEIDGLVKSREDASPVLRRAFEDLHGILDPGQRAALADAIQQRIKENTESSRGWFDELANDLRLSEDQKSRLKDVLSRAKPQLDEERARVAAVLDAFRKEDFSMDKILPLGDVGKRMRSRAEGMVSIAKELTAILTPEQRQELVNRLETKSAKGAPAEESREPATEPEGESLGEGQQRIVAVRGFRAGAVRGWRGGGAAVRRTTVVRTGYAAGYPLVGGYGPGIW
jgi:Spy/CpxP family protein refolding chaperone